MGADTEIAWTDSTFNPWWGCQRVSPGCENCYAEAFAKRTGHKVWGPEKTTEHRFFGEKHWLEPLKWAHEAEKTGVRRRVFCASMADVFEDRRDLDEHRARLFDLIEATPMLDWLLLTKRPEYMNKLAPLYWIDGWPINVWAGATVEDQKRVDERIPLLLDVPAKTRFLSCEPLIEKIVIPDGVLGCVGHLAESFGNPLIHWVIVGGESGHGARPFDLAWARALNAQRRRLGHALFYKQGGLSNRCEHDIKGGHIDCVPVDLRIREFPR